MSEARWRTGDVFQRMAEIPDGSIDAVVCSPPFLALRSYLPSSHPQKHLEIGSEPTPAAFLTTLLALTREWRRILTPTGSLCVELGDTYSGNKPDPMKYVSGEWTYGERPGPHAAQSKRLTGGDDGCFGERRHVGPGWPPSKSLCLIPSLFAGSLAYGRNLLTPDDILEPWRVRNLIVWHRPNPPVGALGDKVRPSTSYVTVACTAKDRWFDLDSERAAPMHEYKPYQRTEGSKSSRAGGHKDNDGGGESRNPINTGVHPAGAPPLDCWFEDRLAQSDEPFHDAPDVDVWTIPTAPFSGAHYATFPPALPRRLINLMCPRQVCTVCGEPRRRIVNDRSAFEIQPILAAHIKERREAADITSAEINERLGYKEIAKNWERTDKHGAAIPNANDWAIIKPWLGLSDDFDDIVLGERRWTESTIDYVADGRTLTSDEKRDTFDRGGNGYVNGNRTKADRHAPDEWSDCGHNTWRRGIVCDPFCGSGTTLQAASELGRDSIGIDLDRRNLDLARQRLGMFLVEEDDGVPAGDVFDSIEEDRRDFEQRMP